MNITDISQIIVSLLTVFALWRWIRFERSPLLWAAVAALLLNLAFYIGVFSSSFSREDHNLISSLRVLLLVLVLTVIPRDHRS